MKATIIEQNSKVLVFYSEMNTLRPLHKFVVRHRLVVNSQNRLAFYWKRIIKFLLPTLSFVNERNISLKAKFAAVLTLLKGSFENQGSKSVKEREMFIFKLFTISSYTSLIFFLWFKFNDFVLFHMFFHCSN